MDKPTRIEVGDTVAIGDLSRGDLAVVEAITATGYRVVSASGYPLFTTERTVAARQVSLIAKADRPSAG